MAKIKTEVVPFGEVFECKLIPDGLGKAHFVIPEIQREYQWGCATELDADSLNRSATQFYNDLFTFFSVNKDNDDPYFLGTLIAYQQESDIDIGAYQLMDGQQRWTTVTSLMSIIRHYLDKDTNEDWSIEKSSIQDYFLQTSDNLPKLQSKRVVDMSTIEKLIRFNGNISLESLDPSEGSLDSITTYSFKPDISGSLLYCVSQFFYHRIAEDFDIKNGNSSRKKLVSFYNCIKDRIYVNLTIAPDATVAYKMFITANARGTSLNNFDIFKALTIQRTRINNWNSATIHKELEKTNTNLNTYTQKIIGKKSNTDPNSIIDGIMADITGVLLAKRVSKSSVLMLMDNHLNNISSLGKLLELVNFIERYTRVSWWLLDREKCNIGRLIVPAAFPIDRITYGIPSFKQHMPIYITAIVSWAPWNNKVNMENIMLSDEGNYAEHGLNVLSHALECYIVRCWLVGNGTGATRQFFYTQAPSIANEIKNLKLNKKSLNKILKYFSDDAFNPDNLSMLENRAFKCGKNQIGESLLTQVLYAVRIESYKHNHPFFLPYKSGRDSQSIKYPVGLMPSFPSANWAVKQTWDYEREEQGASDDKFSQKIGNFFLLDAKKYEIEQFASEALDFNDPETSQIRNKRITEFNNKVHKSKSLVLYRDYLKSKDWEPEDITARTEFLIKQLEKRFPKHGMVATDSLKKIRQR